METDDNERKTSHAYLWIRFCLVLEKGMLIAFIEFSDSKSRPNVSTVGIPWNFSSILENSFKIGDITPKNSVVFQSYRLGIPVLTLLP